MQLYKDRITKATKEDGIKFEYLNRTMPAHLLQLNFTDIKKCATRKGLEGFVLDCSYKEAIRKVKSGEFLNHHDLCALKHLCKNSMFLVGDILQYINQDIYPIYTKESCVFYYNNNFMPNGVLNEISSYMIFVSEVNRLAKDKGMNRFCNRIRNDCDLDTYDASNVFIISSIMDYFITHMNGGKLDDELAA